MTPILSPGCTTGPCVDAEANAELEALMAAAGASFDDTEYRLHGSPSDLERATAGQLADATGIAPGHRVLVLPGRDWPATPDACTDRSNSGEWVLDGNVLVCRGCGLDCT